MKVNILGVEYEILYRTKEEDPKLEELSGYHDGTTKLIVVEDVEKLQSELTLGDLKQTSKAILRHEIIHAFLYESGLHSSSNQTTSWATNEEMIDWLALQFPKIEKAFKEVNAL